jgi:2'-5' RNA ligase
MSISEQNRDPWLGGEPSAPERQEAEKPRPWGDDVPRPFRDDRRPPSQRGGKRSGQPGWRRDIGQPEPTVEAATWRLFIAVELPPAAIEEIGTFINGMPVKTDGLVRWTARENVHITLQFLGETAVSKVPEIQEKLAAAAASTGPILLSLGETGAFPTLHAPRILWIGLTGEVRKLVQLQGRIEGAMRSLGFEPERRPFSPHITVGRAGRNLTDQEAGDTGFGWRRAKLPKERAQVPVSEVTLFRSRLQQGGPVYEKVFTAKLGG